MQYNEGIIFQMRKAISGQSVPFDIDKLIDDFVWNYESWTPVRDVSVVCASDRYAYWVPGGKLSISLIIV